MNINFFTSRLGRDVLRLDPKGRESIIKIETYKIAEYLHELQENGYKFKEMLVIHNNLTECESCSA